MDSSTAHGFEAGGFVISHVIHFGNKNGELDDDLCYIERSPEGLYCIEGWTEQRKGHTSFICEQYFWFFLIM